MNHEVIKAHQLLFFEMTFVSPSLEWQWGYVFWMKDGLDTS